MKILFLHGWHSVPGGVKPSYLVQHGHEPVDGKKSLGDISTVRIPTQVLRVAVGRAGRNGSLVRAIGVRDPPMVSSPPPLTW